MKKYNFQDWLTREISNDPEVILAGKLEYLRLYLTDAMRSVREKAGITQAQLAEKLGVKQAAVSKLESALKDHELESVLRYLHVLEADLLVAVKQGEELYQVSDNEGIVLVDLGPEVAQLAETHKMNLREYVYAAIQHFSQKGFTVVGSVIAFLESDDPVALQVRKQLRARPLSEIAVQLEQCLAHSEEDDRLLAVKNILAGSISAIDINRDSRDENNELELLNLSEGLLEKLTKILKDCKSKTS